jgi:hypothetical protein
MWRIGWRSFNDVVWFGWRDSEEQCLDTIAYNQRLDYDAGEDVSYVHEEVNDVESGSL